MRWWDELRNPALKCARLGHTEIEQTQRVMRQPGWAERYSAVAMKALEMRKICTRCQAVTVGPEEISARPISSWSRPASIAEQFERDGRWVERAWSAAQ